MPERFTPEEAWREAQFLEGAAKRQSNQEGSDETIARHFDRLSIRLDATRKENPLLYEASLNLAEQAQKIESIDPELRRQFLALVSRVSAPVMRHFRDNVEALKGFTKEKSGQLSEQELAKLRAERKNEIVSAYIEEELRDAEELLKGDEQLHQAFSGREDQLEELKQYHFGNSTVTTVKEQLFRMIDDLESRSS